MARPDATRTAAELLAAIHADPADDAARQVYADLLTEQGDPRGELITMQLARAGREPTDEERARERAVLVEHVRAWMGELAAVCDYVKPHQVDVGPTTRATPIRFERGFLAGMTVRPGAEVRTVLGHPQLATIEDLQTDDVELLASARFPALRSLRTCGAGVAVVVKQPFAAHLERLYLHPDAGSEQFAPTLAEQLAAVADTAPGLRGMALNFRGPHDERVVRAALAIPQLRSLAVSSRGGQGDYARGEGGWTFSCDTEEYDLAPETLALAALV